MNSRAEEFTPAKRARLGPETWDRQPGVRTYGERKGAFPMAVLRTLHMSRIVAMPVDEAVAAFDRCRGDLLIRGLTRQKQSRLVLEDCSLELVGRGVPAVAPHRDIVWPARRMRGMLRSRRGWYRVRVELEILPWSDYEAEIGLRPLTRHAPILWGTWAPYVRFGARALDALAREMQDWADAGRLPASSVARR